MLAVTVRLEARKCVRRSEGRVTAAPARAHVRPRRGPPAHSRLPFRACGAQLGAVRREASESVDRASEAEQARERRLREVVGRADAVVLRGARSRLVKVVGRIARVRPLREGERRARHVGDARHEPVEREEAEHHSRLVQLLVAQTERALERRAALLHDVHTAEVHGRRHHHRRRDRNEHRDEVLQVCNGQTFALALRRPAHGGGVCVR
eukprot:6196308-Pleurochrysis_carterae.AAC.2